MADRASKQSSTPPRRPWLRWWPALAVWVLITAVWWLRTGEPAARLRVSPALDESAATQGSHQPLVPPDAETFTRYAGSASCKDCHGARHVDWLKSTHALAERPPSNTLDDVAFKPPREFRHGTQTTAIRTQGDALIVRTKGAGDAEKDHPVVRVIGHEPLRQFLVDGGNGRLQTLEASYDPHRNEWFNVYGNEDRQPGEWGHWTGRGMNWNAMCAGCHNTRVRKNYEPTTDSYRTTMAEPTVSCEACHGPMKEHVLAYKSGTKPPAVAKPTREMILDACGSCHARRAELTGDFHPGEDFFDHYQLTVPDLSGTYYADGQVREENYEFGSFLGSRMHAAGVHCLDCHDAHTSKTILPGNALCMRCHNGGFPNSPKIDPTEHSHHGDDSPGNQCVNCHMPQTVYMQRDSRHDHGFTIPDPLLTKEHNIPNACNRCHADKDTDWSLAAVDKWYGERMNRRTRQRAQAIARARAGDTTVKGDLLKLLAGDDLPYWKAVAANVIDPWLGDADVQQALIASLENTNALLRAHAASVLGSAAQGRIPAVQVALRKRLTDTRRSVRINAAWGLRDEVAADSKAQREVEHFLQINADQPTGQLQLGTWHLARNDTAIALRHFERAVAWDPNSAPFRHELAVLYGMLNRSGDALRELQAAVRLAPGEAEFHYKLGLAWNEAGDLAQATRSLDKAVELNPRHARAWYNLGLARQQQDETATALDALFRAESLDERDPRIPFARATIHAQAGQTADARQAAQRALSLEPNYTDARRLLDSLR